MVFETPRGDGPIGHQIEPMRAIVPCLGSGTLYVVATPIGHLQDASLRSIDVLRAVDLIACEDTRVTRRLLHKYEVETPTRPYHAHSSESVLGTLCDLLEHGKDVALVTDAGTPAISDPGSLVVREARARGITVSPVPGPSALIAALSASGFLGQQFVFLGFLPKSSAAQVKVLAPFRTVPGTLILYESPRRIAATLETLKAVFGDRLACVAREITKKFEAFEHGSLSELRTRFEKPVKGEVVILVAEAPSSGDETQPDDEINRHIEGLLKAGESAKEIATLIAGAYGLTRKEAYHCVLRAKQKTTSA